MTKLTNQGSQIVSGCVFAGIIGGCAIQWYIPAMHGIVMGAIFGASGAIVGQLIGHLIAVSMGHVVEKQQNW